MSKLTNPSLSFLSLVVLIQLSLPAIAQQSWTKSVPGSRRVQLKLRLQEYVSLERNREFDRLYGLLDRNTAALATKTKQEYKQSRQKSLRLVDFRPRSSNCVKAPLKCTIVGQGDLQWDEAMPMRCGVSLKAVMRNGEWYFSEWLGDFDCFPGTEPITTTAPNTNLKPTIKKAKKP